MAKIKITENELKQVIRESVSEVLNERVNYGAEWETLSEPEKQAAAEKYARGLHNSIYQGATYTFPDGTTGTTQTRVNPQTGQMEQGTIRYNMDAVKDIYNRKRDRKQRNGNLTYSADQFNQAQKNSAGQINTLKTQLDTANKTATMYRNAIGAISKALKLSEGVIKENVGIDPSVTGSPQPGVPSTQKQPVGQEDTPVGKAPELDAILGAIKKLNGTIGTQKATITDLTTKLQQSNAQLAQARNQAVRSNAPQPAVNQNQAIPAAKPIQQQTARPAAQAPGTAIAQK